ncbi:MAG: phosphatase PAP2 family protein [Sphingomonadales bacterium]|nr:phosphatase PAP2 family protein [Sphingomonadales bacterium]
MVTCAFALVIAVGLATGAVGIKPMELAGLFVAILLFPLCADRCRHAALAGLADALELCGAFFLLVAAAALASAVLARLGVPLADDALAGMDRWLLPGFDWRRTMLWIDRQPGFGIALSHAYVSLNWQPTALFVWLCLTGHQARARRLLSALALALGFCLAIFPFCPATSAYVHFGVAPAAVPSVRVLSNWQFSDLLLRLRDGRVHDLGRATLDGIVTMPSFHAAAAILLGWGFRPTRVSGPAVALNALMWLSAVPIGGHYLVDIAAGSLVAVLALGLTGGPRRSPSHGLRRAAGACIPTPPIARSNLQERSMPFYDYRCPTCDHRFEVLAKISDPAPSACPACGAPAVEKCLAAPALHGCDGGGGGHVHGPGCHGCPALQ